MYDYGTSSMMGSGMSMFSGFISLGVSVITLIGLWKIYEKAGKPGWAAIIPFYNMYVLFQIVYNKGSKMFLLLIPLYNIYVAIKLYIDLAKVFGQSAAYGIGLWLVSPVFCMLLGFGSEQYQGPLSE